MSSIRRESLFRWQPTAATSHVRPRCVWAALVAASIPTAGCTRAGRPAAAPAGSAQATAEDPSTQAALARLRERPDWLFPATDCPADVVGPYVGPATYDDSACIGDLTGCLDQCAQGEAAFCYAAALRVQELKADEEAHEALFLRACRGGFVSGCTNRAAGMLVRASGDSEVDACAARTFALTCERHDPWGCTMRARVLATPIGVEQDLEAALRALEGSCLHGEEDPACSAAHDLEREIREAAGQDATRRP